MKYRVLSNFDYETKRGDGSTNESFRWVVGDTLDTSKIPGSGNPPLDLEFLLGVGAVEVIKSTKGVTDNTSQLDTLDTGG